MNIFFPLLFFLLLICSGHMIPESQKSWAVNQYLLGTDIILCHNKKIKCVLAFDKVIAGVNNYFYSNVEIKTSSNSALVSI